MEPPMTEMKWEKKKVLNFSYIATVPRRTVLIASAGSKKIILSP